MRPPFLSRNLQYLLQQHQLSAAELSRRCGIAQPVVHRLVVGQIDNPQIATLCPIARYFKCSLDALLMQDMMQSPKNKKISVKETNKDICHQMRNATAIIHAALMGMTKVLPVLTDCYHILPEELRSATLSSDALTLLPKMLENAVGMVREIKDTVNQLNHSTHFYTQTLTEKN